jgi:hypothetical protein
MERIKNPRRRSAILNPQTYVGDAAVRTKKVCDDCELRIEAALAAEELKRPDNAIAMIAHKGK